MPVGQLLYVVVRFWLEFFERCSGGTTRGLNNRGAAGVGG
jgi:hypothetical protein